MVLKVVIGKEASVRTFRGARRQAMVRAVREGVSIYRVASKFRVSTSLVRRRVPRAEGERLDRVDWSSRLPGRHQPVNKRRLQMEDLGIAPGREPAYRPILKDIHHEFPQPPFHE
jgi:hypothetical protein